MSKIILGFVGPIASGKGTACEYLKNKYNAGTTRFSSILRDIVGRLGIPESRNDLQKLSLALRQGFGDDVLAKAIALDVQKDKQPIIGVDGVRRLPDIKYLREIPGFYLVSIDADQKKRFERIVGRGENTDDTTKTFENFKKDEKGEAEKNIQEIQTQAQFHLDNNGTKEELYGQIDEMLKKLITSI